MGVTDRSERRRRPLSKGGRTYRLPDNPQLPDDVVRVRVVVTYDVEVRSEAELVRAALEGYEAFARDNTGGDSDLPEEHARRKRELADPDDGAVASAEWLLTEGLITLEIPGAEIIGIESQGERYVPDYEL